MIPAATREAQATACLQAAERFQPQLLALALRLTGNEPDAMDLFQQSALDCHDAIQSNGFEGDRYEFYLRRAIHTLYYKKSRNRTVAIDFQERLAADIDDAPEGEWGDEFYTKEARPFAVAAMDEAGVSHLAEQMMEEVRARFTPAERVVLRLHMNGESSRDIADLTGMTNHLAAWRLLERLKGQLRSTFRQAWDSLTEAAHS